MLCICECQSWLRGPAWKRSDSLQTERPKVAWCGGFEEPSILRKPSIYDVRCCSRPSGLADLAEVGAVLAPISGKGVFCGSGCVSAASVRMPQGVNQPVGAPAGLLQSLPLPEVIHLRGDMTFTQDCPRLDARCPGGLAPCMCGRTISEYPERWFLRRPACQESQLHGHTV